MKTTFCHLPKGLDSSVLDAKIHFSAGQRSLVCLARAILEKNQILILDEATANLDHSIEHLLMDTICTQFAHCTVLIIAHRLHTIMHCDRILVMDGGIAVEFDHAHNLLKSEGYFSKLVNETADAQLLKNMAKSSYDKLKIVNCA